MKCRPLTFTLLLACFLALGCASRPAKKASVPVQFFPADHSLIRYTGRIDDRDPRSRRLIQPGSYVEAVFEGTACQIILRDQRLWGHNQNYLQIVVDGRSRRIQTTGALDTIEAAVGLPPGLHRLLICKNTEANIGWVAFEGLICRNLAPLPPAPARRIEFIGNSITCGAGVDPSLVGCGKGEWHDQHNAYLSYGPLTARALNARWHLSAVSGIGLIRSCCGMEVLMPRVYDKVDMRGDSLDWDFRAYRPDVITVCLGQNDGVQDSVRFCSAYVRFLEDLRAHHPQAEIVCLTSPMADERLDAVLKNYLSGIVNALHRRGDLRVDKYFFSRAYNNGCDSHPDLADHREIAAELTGFLKGKMGW